MLNWKYNGAGIVWVSCFLGSFVLGFAGARFTPKATEYREPNEQHSVGVPYSTGQDAITQFLKRRDAGTALSPSERLQFVGSIREWLQRDPQACVNFLGQHRAGGLLKESDTVGIIKQSLGEDPAALMRLAQHTGDHLIADALFVEGFRMEMIRSPLNCLEMLPGAPRHLRNLLEHEAVQRVVEQHGADGFESILNRFSLSRSAAMQGIAAVGSVAPDRAFQLIDANRSRFNEVTPGSNGAIHALTSMITRGKPDPDASLRWLRQIPQSRLQEWLTSEVIRLKLQRDPANADAILRETDSVDVASGALKIAAATWATERPDLAQQLIEKIPVDRMKTEAYSNVGRWMILSNPTRALELAAGASNPVVRAQSIGSLMNRWIDVDPAKAIEYAVARIEDPAFRSALSSDISRRLDPRDPIGAAKRLEGLQALPPSIKEAIRNSLSRTLPAAQRDLLGAIIK